MGEMENQVMTQQDEELTVKERLVMPCIPLRGLLVYPNTILHFDVGREKSIKALESAMSKDKLLFVTAQKDESILIPTEKDFYETGTVVKIKQMLKIQGDTVRVLVEGLYRAAITEVMTDDPFISVAIEKLTSINYPADEIEMQAMIRVVLNSFDEYLELNPNIKPDLYDLSVILDDPDMLADTIAVQLNIDVEKKQQVT